MSLAFFFSILLVLGVVFVNGWTDAPNAIGSAVATKVLRTRSTIIGAVIFNFLGVLLMTYICHSTDTIKICGFWPFWQPAVSRCFGGGYVCHCGLGSRSMVLWYSHQ